MTTVSGDTADRGRLRQVPVGENGNEFEGQRAGGGGRRPEKTTKTNAPARLSKHSSMANGNPGAASAGSSVGQSKDSRAKSCGLPAATATVCKGTSARVYSADAHGPSTPDRPPGGPSRTPGALAIVGRSSTLVFNQKVLLCARRAQADEEQSKSK